LQRWVKEFIDLGVFEDFVVDCVLLFDVYLLLDIVEIGYEIEMLVDCVVLMYFMFLEWF